MNWQKKPLDSHAVRELSRKFDLNLLVSSILVRRELDAAQSLFFFLESDSCYLHNPFLFSDMEEAVERIYAALESGEKIMIFGDRDVDGITATVLLVEALGERNAQVDWLLPKGDESYGLTAEVIDTIALKGVTLLITVDCGISNVEEIRLAGAAGIDTIVIDHHNPPSILPDALAIINPKSADTRYPFRDMAGCGVVAKLDWALRFYQTSFYGQTVCLLNIKPVNEGFEVGAAKIVNLVEEERVVENLIPPAAPGMGKDYFRRTRLASLISGYDVLVFNAEQQKRMLEEALGGETGLSFTDIRPLLFKHFPALQGKSLLKIIEMSRLSRYSSTRFSELDMLKALFIALAHRRIQNLDQEHSKVMDLVALGTLADLMPLIDENRIMVKGGLEVLNRMERPGLRGLLIRQDLQGKKITAKDISWQVNPVLNSAGRLGKPEIAAELLLSDNPERINELVDLIRSMNKERKKQGGKVWEKNLHKAQKSYNRSEEKFVLIYDDNINRGNTGIIAARLVNFFKVPAVVIALSKERAVGSLRSPYDLGGFLDNFADIFSNYGGHNQAAGFSMETGNLDLFEKRLYKQVQNLMPPDQSEEKLVIDAEVPHEYLNPDLIKVVEFFEPFGEGNPALIFLTRKVRIESLEFIGKKETSHLKLLISGGKYRWPAVFWRAAERAGKDFDINEEVDIVYQLARNYFQNTDTLQLTILDIHRC
jgi:single-stranded-DNA-specific exonuclease